jgi:TPR repeat protein
MVSSKSGYYQLFDMCTQRNPGARPDMAAVVQWLDGHHRTLPGVDVAVFAEYKGRRARPAAGEIGGIDKVEIAAHTSPLAMCVLARLYRGGIGVARNEHRAIELLDKAIDVGYAPAMEFLLSLATEGAVNIWPEERVWLEAMIRPR